MSSKYNIDQSIADSNLDSINTQILYPISINQDCATIIIPNRGGSLDKNSALVLPAIVDNEYSFLPINTGIASLLDSISLVCNGKVIAQNTEPGQYITMSNSFIPQEKRDRVDRCRSGIREVYDFSDRGQLDPAQDSTKIYNKPGKITLKDLQIPFNEANNTGFSADNFDTFAGYGGSINHNYRLTNDRNTTAHYYLYLEQLFPKLYGSLQLPVYLIEGELSLVIKFSNNNPAPQQNERICGRSTLTRTNTALSCEILTDEVVLMTDYLIPTPEAKNELVKQVMSEQGLTMTYGDLLFNNYLVQGLAAVPGIRNYKRDVFQLGLSNKIVRQLYLMFTPTQNNQIKAELTPQAANADGGERAFSQYNSVNALKNKYCSKALSYLPDGEKIQINFNSKNVFNTPLETSGQKIHELCSAYGSNFCQPSCTYDFRDMVTDKFDAERNQSFNGQEGVLFYNKSVMTSSETANGWSLQNLVGQNHYLGVNLQRNVLTPDNRLVRMNVSGSGTRCGSIPIEIQIDRLCNQHEPNDNRNMIVCACVEKTLQIKNGQIFVEYN